MPTPLTDAINALTTYANTVTGKTPPDTTLSDAVATLASGYGGGGGISIDDFASGAEPSGAITLTTPTTRMYAFAYDHNITAVTTNGTTTLSDYTLFHNDGLITANLKGVTTAHVTYCNNLEHLIIDDLTKLKNQCFRNNPKITEIRFKKSVHGQGNNVFTGCSRLATVYFYETVGTIQYMTNLFSGCSALTDIYVPWSSGDIAGAPWGASNATVHYNTTYDSDGNPQ